jgi:predicted nucleic acid-binding protein
MIQGNRPYIDTNLWIYALEGYPQYSPFLTALFKAIDAGNLYAVTSELTLAELLVKPFIDKNLTTQRAYQNALQSSINLQVFPISRQILVESARLRAETSLKLPDAIHIATALLTHCDTFLTNDKRIQSVRNLTVIQVSQLVWHNKDSTD